MYQMKKAQGLFIEKYRVVKTLIIIGVNHILLQNSGGRMPSLKICFYQRRVTYRAENKEK